MSNITLPYRYKMRGYTAAECASRNEVLLEREWCYETDTGRAKQGDGNTPYNDLPYATPGFIDFTNLADGTALTWDAAAGMLVFADASLADGDKGDITVSGGGTAWAIDNDAVSYAKMQNVSAASRLIGRGSSAGAGDPQEITLGTGLSMTGTVLSASGGGGSLDPKTMPFRYEDFEDFGSSGWQNSNSGGSSTSNTTKVVGHPGIVTVTTGGSSSGIGGILDRPTTWLLLGGGVCTLELGFCIPILSNGTDRFSLTLGLRDVGIGSPTNQLILSYIDNNNSGNWVIRSVVGGVQTDVNAGTGPTAGAWYRLNIVVNAAGTSAEFFINGVSIGTTTAVPAAALRQALLVVKSVGTTSRDVYLDYSYYTYQLTTTR